MANHLFSVADTTSTVSRAGHGKEKRMVLETVIGVDGRLRGCFVLKYTYNSFKLH